MRWLPLEQQVTFSSAIQTPSNAYLWDHIVSTKAIFPGAGFFEAASAAARLMADSAASMLVEASVPGPLIMPDMAPKKLSSVLMISLSKESATLDVASVGVSSIKPTIHLASRTCSPAGDGCDGRPDGHAFAHRFAALLQAAAVPTRKQINENDAGGVGEFAAPMHDASTHLISPSVLDNCLQLGATRPSGDGALYVPAGFKALAIRSKLRSKMGSHGRAQISKRRGKSSTYTDYVLEDLKGCFIDSLEAKAIAYTAKPAAPATARERQTQDHILYSIDWRAHSVAITSTSPGGRRSEYDTVKILNESSVAACTSTAIALAQVAAKSGIKQFSIRTADAQCTLQQLVAPADGAVGNSALWGLARALEQEVPGMHTDACDLTAAATFDRQPVVAFGLAGAAIGCSTYGCAVHQGLIAAAQLIMQQDGFSLPPFRLLPQPRGALQNLQPEVLEQTLVNSQKAYIAVKGVGINFRDLLNVLGMYPGDPGPPGGDCAGVVVSVGENEQKLKPGELKLHFSCRRCRKYTCIC